MMTKLLCAALALGGMVLIAASPAMSSSGKGASSQAAAGRGAATNAATSTTTALPVFPATTNACASTSSGDVRVSCGSPVTPFPQNKQNEPAVAIDAHMPNVVAAGSNDEIDLQPCPIATPPSGVRCPFTQGVGVSGIYFSTDGGQTWTQPTYTGYTARDCTATSCTPHVGSIGTLPNYYPTLVSDGDPSLSFGPAPGPGGRIDRAHPWTNGSRLYYANLTANFSLLRSDEAFKGFEAVAVSYTDNIGGAIGGNNSAWSSPVIATKQNGALFSDKEQVWADNAASSPFFGNVYLCNASFRSNSQSANAVPEPIVFTRSTDGGQTWSGSKQLTSAANNLSVNGRQGCTVRTDSKGVVYVFYISANPQTKTNFQYMTRSFDGGVSFERPRPVAPVVDVGAADPEQGLTIDGLAGVRTSSFPSVDIANGAPSGKDATDEIVLAWPDASGATPSPYSCCPGFIDNEKILIQYSKDQGVGWSTPVNAAASVDGHVNDDAAVAISPDGSVVYLTYDAYAQPWEPATATPQRLEQGVVRAGSATLGNFTTLQRGALGDARGSSTNGLGSEFLGDYNYMAAQRIPDPGGLQILSGALPAEFGVAVWNDSRNAGDCPAVDTYRQGRSDFFAGLISAPPTRPYPGVPTCPANFGNSDIYGGQYTP